VNAVAVVCPLELSADDRDWIESVRALHDPQSTLIDAHFTVVFPTPDISVERMCEHVEDVAGRNAAIDFQLSQAVAVRDHFAPRSHVFLVPDQGDAEVRALHAALYVGDLAPSLRPDIPYQSHVTVAAFETQAAAERFALDLGERRIRGRIRSLAVVSVTVRTIRREAVVALL